MSYKYLDVYVNNLGSIVSTDFPEESINQYSNNFFVRVLAVDDYFDTVTMDILQPNGTTLSAKQLVLQPEKFSGYFAWQYRLSQLDTSVVSGGNGQLRFTIYLNVAETTTALPMLQQNLQASVNSEVVIGDPTSLSNLAESFNDLSADFMDISEQFADIIDLGGVQGPAGDSATISIGTTFTGLPGTAALVTNSGTSTNAVLNFTIPRGETGATGATGAQGPQGPIGLTPNFAIGSVFTGTAGSNAQVTLSGTTQNPILNFSIPRGTNGTNGTNGTDGTDAVNIQLRNDGSYIQWKYENSSTWNNLVALSTITGPQGEQGIGFFIEEIYSSVANLLADTITVGHFGLVNTVDPANQDNGRLYYYGSSGWSYVTDMSVQGIQGPQGVPGATGPQGPQGPQGEPGDVTEFATTSNITANINVGAIAAGDVVPAGTTLQEFIEQLLVATFYPTIEEPTFSLTSDIATTLEIGETYSMTLNANFSRGAIFGANSGGIWNPSALQNLRAGAVSSYTIAGVNTGTNTSRVVSGSIAAGANNLTGSVLFASGPQPLDSNGDPFGAAHPGGSLSSTFTINGVRKLFWGHSINANTSSAVRSLQNFVMNPQNGTTFTLVIPEGATRAVFAYPATLQDVTAVMQVGIFNVKAQFTQSIISVNAANSTSPTNYKVYTFIPVDPYSQTEEYEVTI